MAADMPAPSGVPDAHFAVPVGVAGGGTTPLPPVGTLTAEPRTAIYADASARTALPVPAPRTGARGVLMTALLVVDVVAVLLAFGLMGFELSRSATVVGRVAPGLLAAVVTLGAMRLLGLYRSRYCATKASHLWRIVAAALCGGATLIVAQLPSASPRDQVTASTATAVASIGIGRWWYRRVLRSRRARGQFVRSVLLVGSNADAASLRVTLRAEPELGYAVTGVVAGPTLDPSLTDLPLGYGAADIPRLAYATGASGIVVVPYGLSSSDVGAAIAAAADAGLHVQVWPGIRGIGDGRLRPVPISGEPFFYVEPRRVAPWQLATKRGIDIVGALLCMALSFPLLAVCALLVKLTDRGPVFYRGERVGMDGRAIYPLKLRTMIPADQMSPATLRLVNQRTDGPLFKSSVDPRVTKVGRFLRATSIDELPQLWTVLTGTMSLVGPRPALPSEVAAFDDELLDRHRVRPGMTGLWQVEARHNPSFHAYRRLDLRYVNNWSLRLDLSIIAATIPAVFAEALRAVRDMRQRGRPRTP